MPEHNDHRLKRAFDTKDEKRPPQAQKAPEGIKTEKPAPALKPGGGWRTRAAEVDQRVREAEDAERAQNNWNRRLKDSLRHGKGFNREA